MENGLLASFGPGLITRHIVQLSSHHYIRIDVICRFFNLIPGLPRLHQVSRPSPLCRVKEQKQKNNCLQICLWPKVSTNICQGQGYSLLCSINTHRHAQINNPNLSCHFPWRILESFLTFFRKPFHLKRATSQFSKRQDAATLWVNRRLLSSCHLPWSFTIRDGNVSEVGG